MQTPTRIAIFVLVALALAALAIAVALWEPGPAEIDRQAPSPMSSPASAKTATVMPAPLETTDPATTSTTTPATALTPRPPRTRDPRLGAFVDKNAPGRVAADMTTLYPRIRHEQDVAAVVSVLLDTTDNDTVRHEAANLLRRSGHKGLTDELIKVLDNPAEKARFRGFCVQHLYLNHDKAGTEERSIIVGELRSLLKDKHLPVRREALLALVRLGDRKGKETVLAWLDDPMRSAERDLTIRCVRDLNLRSQMPSVRHYVRAENVNARIAAMLTLSRWGDEKSRAAFEEAAKSTDRRLQSAGKAALKRLDGAADKE
jgi:hypothetical protein